MTKYADIKTKAARIHHIKVMLRTNAQWALRGLLRIYENQTSDEQVSETTRHHNNIGFNGADAEILTSLAKQVIGGRNLSEKQMTIVYRRMPKYARQLEMVATR
jgi:hypothetical protein